RSDDRQRPVGPRLAQAAERRGRQRLGRATRGGDGGGLGPVGQGDDRRPLDRAALVVQLEARRGEVLVQAHGFEGEGLQPGQHRALGGRLGARQRHAQRRGGGARIADREQEGGAGSDQQQGGRRGGDRRLAQQGEQRTRVQPGAAAAGRRAGGGCEGGL